VQRMQDSSSLLRRKRRRIERRATVIILTIATRFNITFNTLVEVDHHRTLSPHRRIKVKLEESRRIQPRLQQ
jgi:hypothetical protein